MGKINIEGVSIQEILEWPSSYYDDLVLVDNPIVVKIGSAEVLGQFGIENECLIVELAQIEGGGEGILTAISKISKHIAREKKLKHIDCIVHALNCAHPNLKLRSFLEKAGFMIENKRGKGEAYFKRIDVR